MRETLVVKIISSIKVLIFNVESKEVNYQEVRSKESP